jgi:hypothetical protein
LGAADELKSLSLSPFAAVPTAPALAHHSFAMFDPDKTVTLKGTVKEFEWGNPRLASPWSWTGNGQTDAIRDGDGPCGARPMTAGGLRKPGDAITVTMHPLKDGCGRHVPAAELPGGKNSATTGRRRTHTHLQ